MNILPATQRHTQELWDHINKTIWPHINKTIWPEIERLNKKREIHKDVHHELNAKIERLESELSDMKQRNIELGKSLAEMKDILQADVIAKILSECIREHIPHESRKS